MGEDIGAEMSFRQFGNLLRYCEPVIRRAVPLALGLISVSNPRLNILDTLSKFSHDSDSDVAHNAIFAMGLVGAGTNNARWVWVPWLVSELSLLVSVYRYISSMCSSDAEQFFCCWGCSVGPVGEDWQQGRQLCVDCHC